MKLVFAAFVLLCAQGAFANSTDNCHSEKTFNGAVYTVLAETDGARTALLVAYSRNGNVLGSDRTEKVDVFEEHGRRSLTTDAYRVTFGDGQPQLIINKTGEHILLICQ
jgi:hypothetical protein